MPVLAHPDKETHVRYMFTYDMMETARNTNEWLGATARAMASYPAFALIPHPAFRMLGAWGRVTERSFARMVIKPDWEIPPIAGEDGQDHIVYVEPELKRPFGDLLRFRVEGHTDARGSMAHNEALSTRRARGVVDLLIARGVAGDRLEAVGKGFAELLDPAEPHAARNRRVRVRVLD